MKTMTANQRGMTFIGLVFVLGFIGLVVLFILKAFPLFNEKIQVVAALESVSNQADSVKFREAQVHQAFLRSLSATTNINRFNKNNIKDYLVLDNPDKRGDPKIMHLSYQATNDLAGGLQLLLNIDEKIPLGGGGETGD